VPDSGSTPPGSEGVQPDKDGAVAASGADKAAPASGDGGAVPDSGDGGAAPADTGPGPADTASGDTGPGPADTASGDAGAGAGSADASAGASAAGAGAGAADAGAAGGGLEQGERAELEHLRAEVAQLNDRVVAPPPRRRRIGWRGPVASLLIVVGCILAPISVMGIWTANQVSSTDRYVATIEPLIHEPAIQNALTDKITTAITTHLNVVGYANQAATSLSSRFPRVSTIIRTFAPSLSSAIAGFVHTQVHKIITSPRVANLWIQVNRTAHDQLVKVLSGQGNGGAISTSNGQVTLDLAPFINVIKQDLIKRGFSILSKLPPIHVTIALFSSKTLVQAQTIYRLITTLKWVLPFLSLLLIALGVYIARNHRRALIGAGLGFAGSMVVLGGLLAVFRGVYINSVPNSVIPSDAAAAAFDIMVRFIKEGLRVLLVVGLVVAAAAFFSGPSVTAVRTRTYFVRGLGRIRETGEHAGLRTGPVGQWVYAHRMGLRVGAAALIAIILLFWSEPSGLTVLFLAIVLLVILGLIELIGKRPARPGVAGHAGAG
jgi:hypothetical protein